MNPLPQNNAVPLSLAMRDTPPAGVTVLSFEISVTGASLQPADASKPAVSLLTSPIEVELEKLETETAFLNTSNVSPGTYNSISVTFANPQMTILNQSGQNFVVANQTCLNGQICELNPPLTQASVSVSSAPFPLMLIANSPAGLLLDFNLDSSIQTNLSVTPTISFTQIPATQPTGKLEEIDDLIGRVTAVGNNQFTLRAVLTGLSFIVRVDGNTEFEFEDGACTTNNFSCVQTGQILKVELNLMPDGTFVAEAVDLEGDVNEEEVEGTVVAISLANNQFQMVVLNEAPDVQNVALGNLVTVNLQGGASFEVDRGGSNIPGGLSFASIQDMMVGQEIQVRPTSASIGVGTVTVNTDRVRLRTSQFTATVSAVSAPNLTVSGLSSLFTSAGINQIQVQTSSQTDFEGVASAADLHMGDTISLRGLLFRTAGDPVLIAAKVRKR